MTELFENTADDKPQFYKAALSKMTEHELDKLVAYFSARLVKRDELLIEELCKTKNFAKAFNSVRRENRSVTPRTTAVQNLVNECVEEISEWNADQDYYGKYRDLTRKQLFVDRWLDKYIPQTAWRRYQNAVRVERSTAASVRDIKAVRVAKPTVLRDYDKALKSFSQQFSVSAPEARGIAMSLGAQILTKLMLETENEHDIVIRESLDPKRVLTQEKRDLAAICMRSTNLYFVSDVESELELINGTD